MNDKVLIMVYLDGHWVPFQDIESCKSYLLRLRSEFNIDIEKARVFESTFVELNLNYNE